MKAVGLIECTLSYRRVGEHMASGALGTVLADPVLPCNNKVPLACMYARKQVMDMITSGLGI